MTGRYELIDALTRRFFGLDIQYRRDFGGGQWPHSWRAQMHVSKNERSQYRLTAYGASLELAVYELHRLVAQIDGRWPDGDENHPLTPDRCIEVAEAWMAKAVELRGDGQ